LSNEEKEMKNKLVFLVLSIALVSGLSAQAAKADLSKSAKLPTLDGSIAAGEYQYQDTLNGIKVAATLGSDDVLYLAVEAPSSGWAGLGVGGLVMNGSRLFLASVQDGKGGLIEKTGLGHFYTDAKNLVVKKWAVKTVGNVTTLELSLPSSAAIWKGQVNVIAAYSKTPNLSAKHSAYAKISFTIK
jgi:hypothetical protein